MSDPSKKSVLFVCVKNGGKSQMAAALMRHRVGDAVEVYSAGTKPGTVLNKESEASVERVGASFADEYPKPIDDDLLLRADRVIVVGSEAKVEPVDGMRASIETWETDEPSLRGIEGDERMDLIRDELVARVDALVASLGVEA